VDPLPGTVPVQVAVVSCAAPGAASGGAASGGAEPGGEGSEGAPSPYTEQTGGLTERREPASRPVLPVCTARRIPRSRPPPVPDMNTMTLRPSSVSLHVPLPPPPESSLPESGAVSALVAELLDFAAAFRLDYASALVAESASARIPSVGGECALGTEVFEDRQEEIECLAAAVPRFAPMQLAPEGDPDAPDIPTPRSYAEAITGTYIDEVPPPGVNIVDGMWIFRVKRPPGSPPAFKARYVARGFAFLQGSLHEEIWLCRPPGFTGSFPVGTQWSLRRPLYGLRQAPREWHDTLRTTLAALGFAPSTADPSLFLCTDTSLPLFYVLVYLGLQITWDRARRTITLTQSHMVHQVLLRFSFQFSSPLPTPLSTSHLLSSPPLDKSVEPSGLYPELVGCLMHQKVHWDAAKRVLRYLCNTSGMGLVLGGRGPVVLTDHADASWVDDSATQRSSHDYTFSLGSGSVSWRSTHSSSVLSSSCEAEIYAEAMAALELRWLTYLLTDLGEQPLSPLVLYVDNKAMIALC
ncbi:unnamed protein product, partial [Closterium sp. NIES-54]